MEIFFEETGFDEPEKVEAFRQEFGCFLYRETGIKLPGVETPGDHVFPLTFGNLKKNLFYHRDIAKKWNEGQPKCLFLPFRLLARLIRREIQRLEAENSAPKEENASHAALWPLK